MKTSYARPIFITHNNTGQALDPIRIEPNGPYDEKWLQARIHEHPECLPISELEKGFDRPISICRELQTQHGPIDNFLMTADGDLILVETKLWKNAEARRTVVAQALDYASCLFAMDYETLERAVLATKFKDDPKPRSLFALFAAHDDADEGAFIDAVSRNLSLGRALVLVVGDGIRSEAAQLASMLQGNPAFNFTFALVEMSIFKLAGEQGLIMCPRVLTQTEMIQRAVVVVSDERVRVDIPAATTEKAVSVAENITAAQFYDAMATIGADIPEKLRAFIALLKPLGVYPDFRKSLNFRWDPPDGPTVSLGYIKKDGEVWTDTANYRIPPELGHAYNEDLVELWGGKLRKPPSGAWSVQIEGRAPRIANIAGTLPAWAAVIEMHLDRIKQLEASS